MEKWSRELDALESENQVLMERVAKTIADLRMQMGDIMEKRAHLLLRMHEAELVALSNRIAIVRARMTRDAFELGMSA